MLEELTTGARKASNGKVSTSDVIMVIKKCTRNVPSNTLKRRSEEQLIPVRRHPQKMLQVTLQIGVSMSRLKKTSHSRC
jgi:hypothetical protein